jgi:DNA-binding GntR family transcriptional regulator
MVLRAPIPEQILPRIRRDIIANRWLPGARLPEPQLCDEFGVSRTPLRQALRALEAEGLIRLVPHVGAIVTNPDAAEVREHMEALSALEQWAVAQVARARPVEALARLDATFSEMDRAARSGDAASYYAINDRFHREIVLATANRTVADLHERLMWHVCRARNRANSGEPFQPDAAENHAPIMAALHEGAPERAAAEMGRHLEEVTRLMLAAAPKG